MALLITIKNEFKKEVGIAIKSIETSSQLEKPELCIVHWQLLAQTHVAMQTHVQQNNSQLYLQNLANPYFGWYNTPDKV